MSTTLNQLPPPLPYELNLPIAGGSGQPSMQAICVQAGDRLYNICAIPTGGDVIPDGSAGAGAGYMPHWCYRPYWARLQDLASPPKDAKLVDGLNGNASVGPTIRVDLQQIYCPWAGLVTIEGGMSGNGQDAPTVLQIAYGWDQAGRQRQRWEETVGELWRRVMTMVRGQAYTPQAPLKVMRFPVDMRTSPDTGGNTLTFYNAGPDSITRPVMSTSVWTPDSQTLLLDNGPGTTGVTVTVNGQSNRAPLGQYSRISSPTGSATTIVFGINY